VRRHGSAPKCSTTNLPILDVAAAEVGQLGDPRLRGPCLDDVGCNPTATVEKHP
jgi:hypothetical protein